MWIHLRKIKSNVKTAEWAHEACTSYTRIGSYFCKIEGIPLFFEHFLLYDVDFSIVKY